MTNASYLSANWTGDRTAGALNPDPAFAAFDAAGPLGWTATGSTAVEPVPGQVSNLAARLSGDAGLEAQLTAAIGPGWFILQAVVTLQAASLTGAGMTLAAYIDQTFATATESAALDFAADPDVTGVVNGPGVAGTTYRFRKLVHLTNPATAAGVLSVALGGSADVITDGAGGVITDGLGDPITDGGSGQGSGAVLDLSLCLVRVADPAEIAAGNPVQGLAVFPLLPGRSLAVTKTPNWGSVVKRAASGRERRTERWPYPVWTFEISHEVIRHRPGADELAGLWAMFNTAQGQAAPWLFLDPSDYSATAAPLGTGDGAATQFQLMRAWDSFVEPVLAPFGCTFFDNGAPASGVTLQPGGVARFATPPAAGHVLTWSGCFFYLCRFAEDALSLDQLTATLWSGKNLKFTSFRS